MFYNTLDASFFYIIFIMKKNCPLKLAQSEIEVLAIKKTVDVLTVNMHT